MGRRRNYSGGQIRVKRAICLIIIFIRSFQEFGHDIKIVRFKSYDSIFGRHSFAFNFTVANDVMIVFYKERPSLGS